MNNFFKNRLWGLLCALMLVGHTAYGQTPPSLIAPGVLSGGTDFYVYNVDATTTSFTSTILQPGANQLRLHIAVDDGGVGTCTGFTTAYGYNTATGGINATNACLVYNQSSIVSGSSASISVDLGGAPFQPGQTYRWTERTSTASGVYTNFCVSRYFGIRPAPPVLNSPSAGATVPSGNVTCTFTKPTVVSTKPITNSRIQIANSTTGFSSIDGFAALNIVFENSSLGTLESATFNLPPGIYYWTVRSSNGATTSRFATPRMLIVASPPPSVCGTPTLNISCATNSISANASTVSGATGYTWRLNGSVVTTTTAPSYTFLGLNPCTSYNVDVQANCSSSSSTFASSNCSTDCPTPCNPPSSLSASPSATSALISWASAASADEYNLRYRQLGSTTWLPMITAIYGTSTNLTSLACGTTYEYQVRSVCSGTPSSWASSSFTTISETLNLSAASTSLGCAAATVPITVTSASSSYSISSSAIWASLSSSSGSGAGTYNVNLTQNTSGVTRTATITFTTTCLTRIFTITQTGGVTLTVNTQPGASVTATGYTPVTANASGVASLNLPCGYSGTLTASKLPCFPVNSTSVSINSSPLTISLPLTSTNVTIFGSVVPASGSLTITGGGPYTYNSSTGEYSFIRPCGWTGNVTYNSTCFNPQTQIISNAVSNTQADFNLAPSVPVGLSVVAPAFDAQMTTCSTEIQWSDLAPAGDYEYEVLATNLAGSVTYLATTTNAPYALVPHGLSGTVVWKVRARIIGCPTWSAWVSSQFKSPYIVVTSPLSSSNWEKGSAQTIIWTSGGLGSASVRISLANTAGDSIYAITNSTPNDGSQNWVTTYAVPAGSYRIRIATNKPDAPCVIALSNIFTISDRNCNEFFINQPVPTTSEAYLATCYLIQKGIIIPQQDGNYNSVTKLKRYLAAKIFFIGNYGDSAALTPADDFLTPFPDLNPNLADNATIRSYRRWARVMTLLEYNDTRTAFDHDTFFSFRGEDNIEEIYYIKALLEAFNINVETYTIPAHFPGEIEADNPMFKWVQKAVDLGIITTSEEPTTTPITRERAFILLYRLLSNPSIMRATPADLHNQENFFIHTISNETNGHTGAGASEAGLNFSQVCLDNANRGFRAVFGFSYSSQSLEMGKELFPNEFLGRGYNFTGNSYMIDYDDLPAYSQFIPADNHLVFNIDGSLLYFKKVGTSYQIQNKGVYGLVVTKISATEYTLRTRDNTLYRFRQLGDNKQPFLLVSLEDRFGNGYTITYEDAVAPATLPYTGYLKKRPQSINFLSCSYRFTYVTDKNLIHKVTEFGSINRFVTFSYNANDNLATYKDVTDTNLYQFWYLTDTTASIKHKENLLWKVRLPKGNIMTNEYNRKKLTSQQVQGPSGTVSRTLYDAKPNENKTTITIDNPEDSTPATASGALGAQDRRYNVEYYPGPWRLQKKVTGPNTNVHYSYADAAHPTLPTKIIDWNITTEYQYNATGDVIQKKITGTDGSVRIQEWTYNSFGDVLTYKDPLGNVTQWQYNAAGALTAIIPPLGWTYRTTYSPNSWGGNDYIQDPYGNRVHFDYQALTGNVWRVRSPLDTVLNTFDAAHRLQITQIRNDGNTANAQAKAYQYDALNRPTRETVAASGMTTGIKLDILYDANGNVIKYINDSGQETTLGYDTHTDFLISESFGGATRTRSYYGDGRLKTITKADGTTLLFEYTNDGRIEKVKNQTTSEVLFTYYYGFGGNPNLVWYILDKFNNKVRYTYDDLNQVIKLDYEYLGTLPDFAVRYEYNLNGQISKLIYPGNKILEYFYNANGWLTKLRTWTGHEINYQYGRDGKPEKIFYPNGVVTTFLYNALRMPVTFGTIRSATGTSPAMTICAYNFTYDDFKNVTIERFVEQYTYANLTSKAGLTTYTHNSANNRLLTSNSPEFGLENFTHDANGRLISKGAHTYGWSVLDQLDNYTNASTGFTANILNDALGQVAAINKNGSLRWFVWSGGNPIMEADASGNPLNYYIYGLGMNAKIKADGTINFYHHDLRGSTIAMTDASGNVSHRYGYGSDGFGEVTDIYEPAGDAQFFRYNGQFGVFHLAEGWGANIKKGQLLSMRARWMDTHTGRFISEDPIWHSNLYPYGDNNPITKVDANGKFAVYVHYASTFIAAMAAGYSLSDADEIAHYASTEADHPSEAILKANQAIAFSVFAGIGGYIGGEDGMIVGGMLGVAVASRIERREGIDYSALQNSQSATSPEMNTLHCMRADGENLTREQAVNRALAGLTNSTNNKVLGNNSHTIQDCTAHNGMSSAEHVSFTKHPISATIAIFKDTFPSAFKFFKATYDTYIYLKSNK